MAGPTGTATSHRIHLIFDFTFDSVTPANVLTSMQLARVAEPDLVHPSRLAPDATRRIGEATLWDWAAWDISPDLHPYVHGILNSDFGERPVDQPMLLRLSPAAVALLEGRYRGSPAEPPLESGFVLPLGRSSRLARLPIAERLVIVDEEAGSAVPVVLEGITLHLFRTKIGLAVVSIRIVGRDAGAEVGPEVLVEMLPRLCDERRTPALAWHAGWSVPGAPRFSLGQTVSRLIEPAGCRLSARERVYTYCVLVGSSSLLPEQVHDVGFRLSRHYTSVYRPAGGFDGTVFVQSFETVLHVSSPEGACTIVTAGAPDAGPRVEFLDNWIRQAHARVYLPLQVAALHEYVALLGLAQGAGVHIDPESADEATIAAMKSLSHRLLLFRLRYRLVHVSAISVHDLVYTGTAKALGLDSLAAKIGRDLLSVERHLVELAADRALALERQHAARQRQRERNAAPLVAVGSGALAYITIASFGDHLSQMLEQILPIRKFPIEVVFQACGIALGIWMFCYTWARQSSGHSESEHLIEHAMHEVAVAREGAEATRALEGHR